MLNLGSAEHPIGCFAPPPVELGRAWFSTAKQSADELLNQATSAPAFCADQISIFANSRSGHGSLTLRVLRAGSPERRKAWMPTDYRASSARLAQLWQFPLLLISLVLFAVAAYLFIDPKPGPTINQKIDIAQGFLDQNRPEAAIEQLNKILASEKLQPAAQ